MKKTKLIFVLIFFLLIMLITLFVLIKDNNDLQEMYIKNSINEPLTQLANNIKAINIQLEEVIYTKEISLNELGNLKTNVIQTSKYLSDFKNNYNEFVENEEGLVLVAKIPENRLIQVQNNLHILNEKLVDKDNDQNKVYEIHQKELELLNNSQVIISNYDGVMMTLENIFTHETIKNKGDFKRSDSWLDFIKKLGNDIER